MSNKFLLSSESNAVTNPLLENLDANGNNVENATNVCLLSLTGNQVCLGAAPTLSPGYTIDFPAAPGVAGECLELDVDNQTLIWTASPGSGNVTGPISSTDNAICRFNGTTGKIIQNSGVTISDTNTIESSSDLTIDTGAFLFDITNTSTDANAIDLQAVSGGIRLTANKPIYLTTSSNSNLNDIELEAVSGRLLVDSRSCRLLLTDTTAQTFSIEANTGGIDLDAGLDITLDAVGDIDLTASDVAITSSSIASNSILLNASDPASGIMITCGTQGCNINGSTFFTAGALGIASGQSITITNAGISFGDGSFSTVLLNHVSPTQNISIRLPNDTGSVGDVISIDSEISNLHTTSFNSIPSILNTLGTVNLLGVDLTLNTLSMNGDVDMNNNSITDCTAVSNATTLTLFTLAGNVSLQGILIDTSNNMSNIESIDVNGSAASSIQSTAAGNAILLDSTGGSGDVNINGNLFLNNGDVDLVTGNIGSTSTPVNIVSTTGQVNLTSNTQMQLLPTGNFIVNGSGSGSMTFATDLTIDNTGSDCNINNHVINTSGHQLPISAYLRFVSSVVTNPTVTLLPPTVIPSSYSLTLPSGTGSFPIGTEVKALLVNSSNNLSFGSDISYVIGLANPVTASVNEIPRLSNVSQYTVTINGSGIFTDPSSNLTGVNNISIDSELRLIETGAGSDYTGFKAPAALASNVIYTLPDADGSADQVLKTSGSGQLSWSDLVPTDHITGFAQTYLGVNSIQFGQTGKTSKARSNDDDYTFILSDTSSTSFSDLTTDQSETANTSYEIYRVGDTTGVSSDAFLWVSESTVITTVSEFTGSTYDTYRKIGWIRNDNSSNIIAHFTSGKGISRTYMFDAPRADLEVLNAGSATAWTDVSCASFCDPSTEILILRGAAGDAGSSWTGTNYAMFRPNGIAVTAGVYEWQPGATTTTNGYYTFQFQIPTSDRIIEYQITSGADDLYIHVCGFTYSLY